MKIAISISGHARNLSLIKILNQLKSMGVEFDTFVSSWDTIGTRISMYDHGMQLFDLHKINIPNLKKIEIEKDGEPIQEIIEACNLHNDVIEPVNYNSEKEFERKYQILSMFRKCQKSIEMVDGDYDFILRTRFDSEYNIQIVLNSIHYLLENKCILLPNNWGAGDETHPGGGRVCDSFAFGPSDLVKSYGRVYDFIRRKNTPEYMLKNDVWFCPHSILLHHLLDEKIKYIKSHIDYEIIR